MEATLLFYTTAAREMCMGEETRSVFKLGNFNIFYIMDHMLLERLPQGHHLQSYSQLPSQKQLHIISSLWQIQQLHTRKRTSHSDHHVALTAYRVLGLFYFRVDIIPLSFLLNSYVKHAFHFQGSKMGTEFSVFGRQGHYKFRKLN